MSETNSQFPTETVPVALLKPHPRNYRDHTPEQVGHIIESIRLHGFYRNIVVAQDSTILAGHGVVKAATKMGIVYVPVVRIPVAPDHPSALKLLAGDNEISRGADRDDRRLSEILREIMGQADSGLLGTGFDEKSLAEFVVETRHATEIPDLNAANEWLGLPPLESDEAEREAEFKLTITFPGTAEREQFLKERGLETDQKPSVGKWIVRWPQVEVEQNA